MKCGRLYDYLPSPYSAADRFKTGANVAESELIRETVKLDSDISWDIFAANVINNTVGSSLAYGSRIQQASLFDLQGRVAEANGYIFNCSLPLSGRLSGIRESLGCAKVPICGMAHSLHIADPLAAFSHLLLSAREYDVCVVSSSAGHDALEQMFQLVQSRIAHRCGLSESFRVPLPQIIDIPFGVHIPASDLLDKTKARTLLRLPQKAFVVCYIGRLSERNKADLDPLMLAVARVAESGRNIHLVLAGQSVATGDLSAVGAKLDAFQIVDRTIVLDNFPEILKSAILSASDVFVSPVDSIQETFGLSILEAMAHGKPVIASSWSGYRDIICDEETGFLLPTQWMLERPSSRAVAPFLGDVQEVAHTFAGQASLDVDALIMRLIQLEADPASCVELGRKGRTRAETKFAWPRVAKQFIELWQDQLRLSQNSTNNDHIAMDPYKVFSHYADRVISRNDLIMQSNYGDALSTDMLTANMLSFARNPYEAESILEIIRCEPKSIDSLMSNNFDIKTIMWLVKKGICRVIARDKNT